MFLQVVCAMAALVVTRVRRAWCIALLRRLCVGAWVNMRACVRACLYCARILAVRLNLRSAIGVSSPSNSATIGLKSSPSSVSGNHCALWTRGQILQAMCLRRIEWEWCCPVPVTLPIQFCVAWCLSWYCTSVRTVPHTHRYIATKLLKPVVWYGVRLRLRLWLTCSHTCVYAACFGCCGCCGW